MTTALVFCVPEGRAMLFIRRCYELPYKKFNSVCEIWVLLSKRILPLPEFIMCTLLVQLTRNVVWKENAWMRCNSGVSPSYF